MPPVSFLRRSTAALSSALLLQLSLLASGTLCPMRAGHATAGHAMHPAVATHQGHAMAAGAPLAATEAPATAPSAPTGCDMSGTSCDMPWSPGGCAAMSACAIGTTAPVSAGLAFVPAPMVVIEAAGAALLPLGPTYAPELPPPRI